MPDRLPMLLGAYRLSMRAATPLAPLLIGYRLRRGKEQRTRIAERYAETRIARPEGPLVWVHGASVGEMVAAIPLIEQLQARGLKALVTTGTVTSADLAAQRLPTAIHQFVPLDAPRFATRFVEHWRPDLVLFMESDLWPNLILTVANRGVPLVLVNGRVSQRSFRRWRRVPRTIAMLLQRFQLCLAQSHDDGRRYAELGATVNITGNLKIDVPPPRADAAMLRELRVVIGDRAVIAAASTHAGEEAAVIAAHQRLRIAHPDLLTVIAPRHPVRGPDIAAAGTAAGLRVGMRSRGDAPGPEIDIYVFDTVGEFGLLYRIAPIVFMGGSLIDHGGQNPIEAAKLGAAILHGPHVWNFTEIYAALDGEHGAELVGDGAALADKMAAWLDHPNTRDSVAIAARKAVDALGGALERTLAALEPYLQPLGAKRRADNA